MTFFPVGLRQWRESFDYWRGSKFRWTGPHLRHTQSGYGQSLDLVRRQIVGHRSRLLQKNPHGIHHSQAQNVRRILVKGFHLRWELKYTTFSYRRLTNVWSIFIRPKRFNRFLPKVCQDAPKWFFLIASVFAMVERKNYSVMPTKTKIFDFTKVCIFWEGHEILQNLHLSFDIGQK